METIISSAVRIENAKTWRDSIWRGKRSYPDFTILSAPPPARHHTIMHPSSDHGMTFPGENQGFLTSKGRFVGRVEAKKNRGQVWSEDDRPPFPPRHTTIFGGSLVKTSTHEKINRIKVALLKDHLVFIRTTTSRREYSVASVRNLQHCIEFSLGGNTKQTLVVSPEELGPVRIYELGE